MAIMGLWILILSLGGQTGAIPACEDALFSPEEKVELQKAKSVEDRVKIYHSASMRIQKRLQDSVAKEEFGPVPEMLKAWTQLLQKSLEDLESNLKTKKKPRSLIRYEIQVRKAIVDTGGYKLKASPDLQDAFDACLAPAEGVHKKIVEMLFRLTS
jgi:hypothetical protein